MINKYCTECIAHCYTACNPYNIYKYCVFHTENLDAMIALQTKNKLGKSLVPLSFTPPTGKSVPQHCKLQVIHCRRLWHHYTAFPSCSRKSIGWWWQHQNRSCPNAERVWDSQRLDQRRPDSCWNQWVNQGARIIFTCLRFGMILKASQLLLV